MSDLSTAAQDLLTDYRERYEAGAWVASLEVGVLDKLAKLTADYAREACSIMNVEIEASSGIDPKRAASLIAETVMDEALEPVAWRYFTAKLTEEIGK